MSATHSSLSPSAADRWTACPGSIALSATVPKKKSSPAAAEGTCTHTLSEWLVTGERSEAELRKMVGTKMTTWDGFVVPVTDEMVDGAVLYHKTILDLQFEFADGPLVSKVEAKVIASSIDKEVRGTADFVMYRVKKRLAVIDLKYGKKAVNPIENKQLGIYLVGVMDSLAKSDDFEELELIVVQPRAGGKPVRRWIVPKEWVAKFREEMRAAVAETRKPNARLSAGNHCFFCPVKGVKRDDGTLACPEIGKELARQAQADFSAVPMAGSLPDPRKMAAVEIAKVLSWRSVVESWMNDLEERAAELRKAGIDVPGLKLVESVTHRKWAKDEKEIVESLELLVDSKDLYDSPSLKSPAAVDKLIGGKRGTLETLGLVTKPEGRLIMVPLDDGREEVQATAAEDFGVVAEYLDSSVEELLGLPAPKEAITGEIIDFAQEAMLDDLMGKPKTYGIVPCSTDEVEQGCIECDVMGTCLDHQIAAPSTLDLLDDLLEKKPRAPLWPQ